MSTPTPEPRKWLMEPRKWLIGGGGGHEDGEAGLRALTVSGEGLVEFLEAYHDDLLVWLKELTNEMDVDVLQGLVEGNAAARWWASNLRAFIQRKRGQG